MQLKSCRWLSVCISPHLEAIVSVLAKRIYNFSFLFLTEDQGAMRRNVGWTSETSYQAKKYNKNIDELIAVDLFIDNVRQLDVLEQRAKLGKVSVYMGERWFKPPLGVLRLFVPSYQKMARHFYSIFTRESLLVFPCGIHAVRDMLRMIAFFRGDWKHFITTPKVAFESRPGGRIFELDKAYQLGLISQEEYEIGKKTGFVQIQQAMWNDQSYSVAFKNIFLGGYIVESNEKLPQTVRRWKSVQDGTVERPFRILWAGRMLDWKRTNILIKAVHHLIKKGKNVSLLVVGEGPERKYLLKCAGAYACILDDSVYKRVNEGDVDDISQIFKNQRITFSSYLKSNVIQQLMREEIDLYVMSSDGGEGWGAVVSEAILSHCPVLSTIEAGSSATLLPNSLLYPAKSVKICMQKLIQTRFHPIERSGQTWNGEQFVDALLANYKEVNNENL